jgi:hypothetical protein
MFQAPSRKIGNFVALYAEAKQRSIMGLSFHLADQRSERSIGEEENVENGRSLAKNVCKLLPSNCFSLQFSLICGG